MFDEEFAILEQAALQMIGVPDEAAHLEMYRAMLRQCLLGRGIEQAEATRLADKFTQIIALRRQEIALAAGTNGTMESVQ